MRGVGQHALDVVLRHGDRRREQRGEGADEGDHSQGRGRRRRCEDRDRCAPPGNTPAETIVAAWISARHRRRAFHRVGQPDVQRELGRLADRAAEDQQRDHRWRWLMPRAVRSAVPSPPRNSASKICTRRAKRQAAGLRPQEEQAEQHQHVADARGDEGLEAGARRRWAARRPEADQQVRAQAHDLPGHEEEQQVVGHHHQQHRRGEERDVGEEAALARVAGHVADREQMDAGGGDRHHGQHRGGWRVHIHAHGEAAGASRRPGEALEHHGGGEAEGLGGGLAPMGGLGGRRPGHRRQQAEGDQRSHSHQAGGRPPAGGIAAAQRGEGDQREAEQRQRRDQPGVLREERHHQPFRLSTLSAFTVLQLR